MVEDKDGNQLGIETRNGEKITLLGKTRRKIGVGKVGCVLKHLLCPYSRTRGKAERRGTCCANPRKSKEMEGLLFKTKRIIYDAEVGRWAYQSVVKSNYPRLGKKLS